MSKILFFMLALFITNVSASEADIKSALQKKIPAGIQIIQINKSPVPGLYEVVTQEHIFYTDEKTTVLIDGAIFDLKTMRNVTDERSRKFYALDFNKLPLELAIKKIKGKGERKIAIFSDPNCGFCKKLEQELKLIDNVTIYQFLYPIFPGSDVKVSGVLCSKDPVKAWDDLMQNGVNPPSGSCETGTEKVMALGRKLKVNGTPALIFADGTINPGYMPAAELEKALTSTSSH